MRSYEAVKVIEYGEESKETGTQALATGVLQDLEVGESARDGEETRSGRGGEKCGDDVRVESLEPG